MSSVRILASFFPAGTFEAVDKGASYIGRYRTGRSGHTRVVKQRYIPRIVEIEIIAVAHHRCLTIMAVNKVAIRRLFG